MKIYQTPVLSLTKRKLTSLLQSEAIKNKEFTNFLYENNLRSNVTKRFTESLFPDTFDAQGHLTDKTVGIVKKVLKGLNLDENTTVKTLMKKLKSFDFDINFTDKEISEIEKVM